jgi:hypothetical protein
MSSVEGAPEHDDLFVGHRFYVELAPFGMCRVFASFGVM